MQHTYRYAVHSKVVEGATPKLGLATADCGGERYPYFFEGYVRQPRLVADLLTAVHIIVGSRFYTPPGMDGRPRTFADPVVTSGGGVLRFEGFSSCCGAYIRADLLPQSYEGDVIGKGTTNVDFNAPMRTALARVRDAGGLVLAVGQDELTIRSGGTEATERKVELPTRWLRGMLEVQSYQAGMNRRFEVSGIDALRLFRALPKAAIGRTPLWIARGVSGLYSTTTPVDGGVRVMDTSRLRVLQTLLPQCETLSAFADDAQQANACLDELVERVAYVFENSFDLDELERVIGALARAAPLSEEARQRFAPVAQRLPKLRTPLAHEVGRMLHFLLAGERIAARPTENVWGTNLADQHLIRRVDEVMNLAALGKGLVPLTTPTHVRGFIDPQIFVERVRAHCLAGASTSMHEQASALLRLTPQADRCALEAARSLPDTELTRALRYALGDNIERPAESALFAAAARIRREPDGSASRRYGWFPRNIEQDASLDPFFRLAFKVIEARPEPSPDPVAHLEREIAGRDKGGWFDRPTVGGRDEGFILYHSMLVPSDLETVFGDGAGEIAHDIGLSNPQNPAYLRLLLDPTVVMSPMASLLLAVALAGKDPAQTAIAVDALVHTHAEARLDASLLAATMRDLLRAKLVDMARYAKSFRNALRIDPAVSPVIFELICTMLEANPAEPPRGTNALLEVLLEIAISDDRGLCERRRRTLEQLALSGKGSSLRKALLKRAAPKPSHASMSKPS